MKHSKQIMRIQIVTIIRNVRVFKDAFTADIRCLFLYLILGNNSYGIILENIILRGIESYRMKIKNYTIDEFKYLHGTQLQSSFLLNIIVWKCFLWYNYGSV